MDIYERFVLDNADQVTSLEGSLRSLTYLLPGRFEDAELASEIVYSATNLLSLYHDTVLLRESVHRLREGLPHTDLSTPADRAMSIASAGQDANASQAAPWTVRDSLNRYLAHLTMASPRYYRVALLGTILQHAEVLIEMTSSRWFGESTSMKIVASIEAIKVALRLWLLHGTPTRMLLTPSLPEREKHPVATESSTNIIDHRIDNTRRMPVWKMPRTGKTVVKLDAISEVPSSQFLASRTLGGMRMCWRTKIADFVGKLDWQRNLAEHLYILRPLIYVLCLIKYGRNSWRPWILSLGVDVSALVLTSDVKSRLQSLFWPSKSSKSSSPLPFLNSHQQLDSTEPTATEVKKNSFRLTPVEVEEYRRRMMLLLYYVLRGPFYENFTKPRLDALCDNLSRFPILSIIAGFLRGYQPLWEKVYFYTSAS